MFSQYYMHSNILIDMKHFFRFSWNSGAKASELSPPCNLHIVISLVDWSSESHNSVLPGLPIETREPSSWR